MKENLQKNRSIDAPITNFTIWQNQVSDAIKKDQLWDLMIYRKALFLSDLSWHDCQLLLNHELGRPIAWQLIRSAGSIPANMEEGSGRGYGKDYARFLRIALGSAKETRGWYYRGRHILRPDVIKHRNQVLQTIIGGLVTLSNQQRQR